MEENKLVHGHGINDVNYVIHKYEKVEGFKKTGYSKYKSVWVCPYYRKWTNMLNRVYNETYHKNQPTYKGSSVCNEWLIFSNFIEWVDSQPEKDWINLQLDKDFLIEGNKYYSPNTVVFVSGGLNTFIKGSENSKYLQGVTYMKNNKANPYMAQCKDPFRRNRSYLGYYPTELSAHLKWKTVKHKYALELSEVQSDPRIAEVLREKYKVTEGL